jgi:hypothetical protein
MNRKLARKVAKAHGVSVREVREGCQEAIDHAYKIPYSEIQNIKFAGDKPTSDELIAYVVNEARARTSKT